MVPWKIFLSAIITIAITSDPIKGNESTESLDASDGDGPLNDDALSDDYVPYTNTKMTKGGRRRVFAGGCSRQPDSPINGRMRCSLNSGCIAICDFNYKFPNGVTQLAITCQDREWHIFGTDWNTVPHCEPICMPECMNNGACVAPHQCDCPENFSGPQCQFERKPCLDYPPPVLNSYKRCNSKSCTISCMKNFTFPDGSAVTNLLCKNGIWEPTRQDWVAVPDCEPVCDPPCLNGGNCLPSNLCQCPQAYRGPQCQYSADACNAERIGFNGGFYCTSIEDSYSCTLNCPAGIEFEFPPAAAYTCTYDKGVFEPQPIPQCKFSDNLNIISLGTTYNSYVRETNHTWTIQDIFNSQTKSGFEMNYDLSGLYENPASNVSANMMMYSSSKDKISIIEDRQAKPKTCFTWGGVHYKTFDDNIFSFDSDCSHVLVQESRDSLFTIIAGNSPTCKTQDCFRIVKIFFQEKEYTLSRNAAGFPEFRTPRKVLPIPAQLPGLRVEMSAHFTVVTLDSLGIQLKWDGALLLQIEALENMWNRTSGLCGNMNNDKADDFVSKNGDYSKTKASFASSWRTQNIGETCDEYPSTRHACASKYEIAKDAVGFCTKLLSDRRFHECSGTIALLELQKACLWDYCACKYEDKKVCACDTMNVYIRQCAHKKIVSLAGWRSDDTCPMSCTNGRVYMPCGPKTEASCWTDNELEKKANGLNCEEGCFCPEGTLAHEGKCIRLEECPCRLRGKLFPPGKSVPKDCNTCTCSSGKWICTQTRCGARCAVIGDPHYTTFDGKHYDFMGKCKYYLMKDDNYSIEGENVPCSGAISENLGLVPTDAPSCTKTVTINFNSDSIKLKQNRQVLINGDDVTALPTMVNNIRIRVASSIFLIVHLPNGLEIWWDGISRIYINAPPEFHGKTRGLCGTFTASQKDDFITPDGDIEQGAISFANKWKSEEFCVDIPEKESKHPCDLDPQKREAAKTYCSYLYSDVFAGCHWHVDPESFHQDCMFDMCACDVEIESCLCPTLAAYAKDCAAMGIKLSWRDSINECKIHCTRGQVYQICGNSCTRSCGDVSFYQDCKQECVEGCNCPEGETLDINGECIPIGQCPCTYAGLEFQPGHREVRPGIKAQELCTCAGGVWNCRVATKEEIQEYPAAKDISTTCVASNHLEITDCVPIEPRTCRNMHKTITHDQTPALCKSGCICKPGYVLDEPNGTCIKEESCPCHHGGQSYNEGSVIQEECNTCECVSGKWKCTDRICAGVCSAWGDSHYKTFDDRIYDFQGVCDYVLVKGSLSKEESFDVSIQNVPCGTTGVSCSKSIAITIGGGDNQESIILTRGKEIPSGSFNRIAIRTAGLFVFVDAPDLGLTVQWDKGTRVYVRLDPRWKSRTKGLCGDYNDNSEDDFKTPSGGISEASANLFGDSWKKDDFCPEPKDVKDPCQQHPERKLWAQEKCGVLKSSVFQPCHSEVQVEPYLRNCIFDTCGCDSGGDCECLCTALAAYAQECNARGVPIKWRNQDLCPIQCDEKCSAYSPCIATCPRETCDNLMLLKDQSHLCAQDTCVEGCSIKPCPQNHVYVDGNYTECVPKETCKPFCTEINGVSYYEGDNVSNDTCQTCFCTRGKVLCKGEPCTTTFRPITIPLEEPHKCVDGWTAWINNDPAIKGKKFRDVEPLPTVLDLASISGSAVCDKMQMVDIKCRSVKHHLTPKETGLDVECSLERGLYCKSQPNLPCVDFEISVLCRCNAENTETTESSTTRVSTDSGIKECSLEHPNIPHPTDCHLFYQCAPGVYENEAIEKSCGPDMFYNPETQVCDWPATVLLLRPECSSRQTTPTKIEWTSDKTKFKTTLSTTLEKQVLTTKVCKEGETWSDCAIDCNKACDYYNHVLKEQGQCYGNSNCIPGCVPLNKPDCSPNKFWNDAITCVDVSDCSCKSHDGRSVVPGAVIKESECEICQCINNYYTCDKSMCYNLINDTKTSTERQPPTRATTVPSTYLPFTSKPENKITTPSRIEETTILIPSTVSPPAYCISNNFVPLVQQLSDQVSFDASSVKGPIFRPENSMLNGKVSEDSAGYWEPEYVDLDQWLDIKFQKPEPIYGIVVQGSDVEEKFVTSYRVLFSENGQTFSYSLDDEKQPRVFRGPVDGSQAVEQKFYEPIEAKIVRINPLSWHNGIAMRVELLGCQDFTTSTSAPVTEHQTTPTPIMFEKIVSPVCKDPMGLEDGLIFAEQLSASSSATDLLPNLRLTSPNVWRPSLDNPHQYVKIDFLEPRNLTGIMTKGGEGIWTTAYKLFYSTDDRHWNPIIDQYGGEEEFLGNFDSENVKTNYFERPLSARYLKIQPLKWHDRIGLKFEILGCFLPYPPITRPTEKLETTPAFVQECNVCEGVTKDNEVNCKCEEPYWWRGDSCVIQQECPCMIGHIAYNVGAMYETEDCQQCICTLGGISTCLPKKCEPCREPGMQSVVTELCNCVCKPCPSGTRHCPTSDVCIDENLWCNGVQDCPDDETDCPKIVATTPPYFDPTTTKNVTATSPVPRVCQDPICPPGYKTALKPSRKSRYRSSAPARAGVKSMFRNRSKTKGLRKTMLRYSQETKNQVPEETTECPEFTCVPVKPPPTLDRHKPEACPEASCPPNYRVVYEKMSMHKLQKCPRYTCQPPPPEEVICNVTGRTFNTFDKLEYKYDICNHILARDMFRNKWYITLEKQCDSHSGMCSRVLAVTLDDYVVVLYPDMHVDINEYTFTPRQIARIGDKISAFKISNIGDVTYLVSNYYGFWVIWDSNSNVKIGIPTKLSRAVDGLCGYFDGYTMNDRQLPDGTQARTTVDFGNSWAMEGVPECDPQVCPYDVQSEAWKICNVIKDRSLAECSGIVDFEKFASRCVESTCNCLRSNRTYDDCRCRSLTNFVTECQAGDLSIDLSTWRSAHDCPVTCPAPFVHKDCFRNKCESSCDNLQQVDPCPSMPGVCFSGCFCPEGTVRNGDECVPPTHCRDCTCEWLENSKFISFDRKNIKFDGNCTYILSRDTVENKKDRPGNHEYQVLVSNGICETGTCTEVITVLYKEHVTEVKQNPLFHEFEVIMDGQKVNDLPFNGSWIILDGTPTRDLKLLIPAIQLEITSFQPNFVFTLTLPSHIFGGTMEGLCGNCNGDAEDDLKKHNGEIAMDSEDFGTSWFVTDSPPGTNFNTNDCTANHGKKCILPPVDQNPCRNLLSEMEFGQCHNLVDPMLYVEACEDSLCSGGSYCDTFEAYARKCQQVGICPIWRSSEVCPYSCPSHLEYRPCSTGCKETCENLLQLDTTKCSLDTVEGCFCPHNYVLHNETCIPREKCFVCDEEGHVEGDLWYPDICTKCTCDRKMVNCQKTECPVANTICEEDMMATIVNGTEGNCCATYICVPKSITTAAPFCIEETQMPECGYGQVMKVSTDADGCKKFICECLPANECPVLNEISFEVEELLPGFEQITNTSGCCPRSMKICNPETCPPKPKCSPYYEIKTLKQPDACCEDYECEPPKDLCLYTVLALENEIEKSQNVLAKKIGEEWMDGKCTTCVCEYSDGAPNSKCSTTECLSITDHPDISDFVLEEVLLDQKCCPSFERSACRDGDMVYNVGDTWQPDAEDSCVTVQCVKDANGIRKENKVQDCNRICDFGFEYQPTDNRSVNCCGRCTPVGCVVGDQLKQIGELWYSDDHCTTNSCKMDNGSVYVQAITEKCPEIEENEFETEKRFIPGRCCPETIKVACRANGNIYKPGEKWKSINDNCVTELCVLDSNVTKRTEVEVCTKQCAPGWTYEEPKGNDCCGKCKETYCVVGDMLYEPGVTWSSADNCTTYSCMEQGDQLSVSTSSLVCPDITHCPVESIYTANCCKQCNLTALNQKSETCAADVLDNESTIGMFTVYHRLHGTCKNLEVVEGITECRGKCESTSHFDTENWSQVIDCKCCQPTAYVGRIVQLTCEDDKKLKKQVAVPTSCSCEVCGSGNFKGTKGRTKG